MASPQAENGHVDIANDIVEALAKIRIPGEAAQVLWFILRKKYGWHKKDDAISLSQFEEGTGLKRSHVCRSLKKLSDLNIIYKGSPDNGTTSPNNCTTSIQTYGFQKDFEKWGVVPKKVLGSPKIGNRVVPNLGHTKETITKEIKTLAHFDKFWSAYPKKKSKGQAERTWMKIKPDEQLLADMLATIERAKTSDEWTKDDGKYIPYPSTWLNAKGWEDEFECKTEKRDPYEGVERV